MSKSKTSKAPAVVEATPDENAVESFGPAIVFVGFTARAIDALDAFMPEFHPDARVKEEAVKIRQIADKKAAFEQSAPFKPFFGRVESVWAADMRSRGQFSAGKPGEAPTQSVASDFWNWLCQRYPASVWPDSRDDNNFQAAPLIVGFGAREFVKLVGAELLQAEVAVPLRFHKDNFRAEDPFQNVVSSDASCLTHDVLVRMLHLLPEQWPADTAYTPGKSPEIDAMTAMRLTIRSRPRINGKA